MSPALLLVPGQENTLNTFETEKSPAGSASATLNPAPPFTAEPPPSSGSAGAAPRAPPPDPLGVPVPFNPLAARLLTSLAMVVMKAGGRAVAMRDSAWRAERAESAAGLRGSPIVMLNGRGAQRRAGPAEI